MWRELGQLVERATSPVRRGRIEAVTPAYVQSCRDDHWSAELLGRMDAMQVTDDPHGCNHLFTNDQAVGLARRVMAVMTQRLRQH